METESGRLLQTEMLRPVSCKTAHNGGVGTCVLLCRVALRLQQKHDVIYKCCMLQCNTDSNQFFNQHVTMYVSVWPVIESHKNASTVLMFNLDTERTMWKCIQCRKYFFLNQTPLITLTAEQPALNFCSVSWFISARSECLYDASQIWVCLTYRSGADLLRLTEYFKVLICVCIRKSARVWMMEISSLDDEQKSPCW